MPLCGTSTRDNRARIRRRRNDQPRQLETAATWPSLSYIHIVAIQAFTGGPRVPIKRKAPRPDGPRESFKESPLHLLWQGRVCRQKCKMEIPRELAAGRLHSAGVRLGDSQIDDWIAAALRQCAWPQESDRIATRNMQVEAMTRRRFSHMPISVTGNRYRRIKAEYHCVGAVILTRDVRQSSNSVNRNSGPPMGNADFEPCVDHRREP